MKKDYIQEVNANIDMYIRYKRTEYLETAKRIIAEMKENKKALAGHKSA
ncbi:hypothetical protein [Allofustis seminis]|nr:hypothetical protein [Allofustis seminis]